MAVYLPLKGISVVSAPGQPFAWPAADASLFRAIRETLRPDIPLFEMDLGINDPAFAEAVADGLLQFLGRTRGPARAEAD